MSGGLGAAPSVRSSAAVVSDLMKLPPVWMPSAMTSGVQPRWFLASTSAPRSTRNRTIESARSRHAAPCSAVSPFSLTAFTSAPSSTTRWTASSASASAERVMPGSWPTPAACISAVVPSRVGMNGSAPAASSSRITGRSFALAAITNGVEPRMFPRCPFT